MSNGRDISKDVGNVIRPGHFLSQTIDMLLDFFTIQKFDTYMRFPWSTTHGMPLYFLYLTIT